MNGLHIYLKNGNFQGPVTMRAKNASFRVTRVSRKDVPKYSVDMEYPGLYMRLIDKDTVYVGQTSMNTIAKRIMSTHTGTIDASWHTVLAFSCVNSNISANELQFMENALTEYAHKNYAKCVTTNPSLDKCNDAYRRTHYKLTAVQINSCNEDMEEIKAYIEMPSRAATICVTI